MRINDTEQKLEIIYTTESFLVVTLADGQASISKN